MTIAQCINKEDWEGLDRMLNRMSNSEFRRTEATVREVLTHVDNDLFWKAYLNLLKYRKQSFLSCVLSIKHLAKNDKLNFDSGSAKAVAEWVEENAPELVQKILRMAIPELTTEAQIEGILRLFDVIDKKECLSILVKEDSSLAYYMLFKLLKNLDDHDVAYRCCIALMKRNNDLSYNMASILRCYFGIDELKATFSLQIEPYELSYIEQNYDNFKHILNGKRPRL